ELLVAPFDEHDAPREPERDHRANRRREVRIDVLHADLREDGRGRREYRGERSSDEPAHGGTIPPRSAGGRQDEARGSRACRRPIPPRSTMATAAPAATTPSPAAIAGISSWVSITTVEANPSTGS